MYGRIFFGATAVFFGVICLMWHDGDTWQNVKSVWSLPAGNFIGTLLMLAQIIGGLGLLIPRTARTGAILLGVVYIVFCLANIPTIVPNNFISYYGFFESLSMLCAASAAYAVSTRSMSMTLAARIGLGLCAVVFAIAQIVFFKYTASLVPKWIPPDQAFWTILTTVAFGLAAIAILVNRQARLAMRLMAVMIALFGLLVCVPTLIAHPHVHYNWSEFAINNLIAAASWLVADATRS